MKLALGGQRSLTTEAPHDSSHPLNHRVILSPAPPSDRAHELMGGSLVIDSSSLFDRQPLQLFTEEMRATLPTIDSDSPDGLVRMALGAKRALESISDAMISGGADEFWQRIELSGTHVACVTLGGGSNSDPIGDLASWTRLVDQLPRFMKVLRASDARRARDEGRRGLIWGLNGIAVKDSNQLEMYHRFGVRAVQFTDRDLLSEAVGDGSRQGLSKLGAEVVSRCADLGLLVDLQTPCSDQTALDVLETSKQPVIVGRGFARAVSDHPSGKSDAFLQALAGQPDAYFGVCVEPHYITSVGQASLRDFVAHVNHVVAIIGVDRVGIGTDWGGDLPTSLYSIAAAVCPRHRAGDTVCDPSLGTLGFSDYAEWPNLVKVLLEEGYSDSEVRGLIGENFLRVFQSVCG